MANNSLSGTLTTNSTINIHSSSNVGIGNLGIGTYLLNTNTITSTTNYSNFSFVTENQPETEEMVEDNNEEHLI
jgi:hypothetical protein